MAEAPTITAVPVVEPAPIPRWVWLAAALAIALFWAVTFETGQLSHTFGVANNFLHELFHDGRHLIGVPCH